MKIVLYGATGKAGSRILTELLSRKHAVKAVVHSRRLEARTGLTIEKGGDIQNASDILQAIRGSDAVVSAYAPPADNPEELTAVTAHFIQAVREAAGPRFVMVGGASSLLLSTGTQLLDAPFFPDEWKAIGEAHRRSLAMLLTSDINWTYFSPAAYFEPGQRTGLFRLGKDELVADENGQSRISMEDYAIALVDELEHPRHEQRRFSIGYKTGHPEGRGGQSRGAKA